MNEPSLLYHYASIDAFKGILDSEYLRMTRYDQLNDPIEIEYARNAIITFLREYNCPSEHDTFRNYLVEAFENYKDLDLFVTSFSEESDYLEQWRAYTPNGGVSIGFDFQQLKDGFIFEHIPSGEYIKDRGIVQRPNGGWSSVRSPANLYKCSYVDWDKKDIAAKYVSRFFVKDSYPAMFNKINNQNAQRDLKIFISIFFHPALGRSIYNVLCAIKHPAYIGEKEWRWVNINPKPEEFSRYLDHKNRIYVQGRIHPEKYIKEVWISPHGDKITIRRVLEFYKETKKLNFDIYESKIPYRL